MNQKDTLERTVERTVTTESRTHNQQKRSGNIVLTITLASALGFIGGCGEDQDRAYGQIEQNDGYGQQYSAGNEAATTGTQGHGGTSSYWFFNNRGYNSAAHPYNGGSSIVRPVAPSSGIHPSPVSRGIFGGTARGFSGGMG